MILLKTKSKSLAKKLKITSKKAKTFGLFSLTALVGGVGAMAITNSVLDFYSPDNNKNGITSGIVGLTVGVVIGTLTLK